MKFLYAIKMFKTYKHCLDVMGSNILYDYLFIHALGRACLGSIIRNYKTKPIELLPNVFKKLLDLDLIRGGRSKFVLQFAFENVVYTHIKFDMYLDLDGADLSGLYVPPHTAFTNTACLGKHVIIGDGCVFKRGLNSRFGVIGNNVTVYGLTNLHYRTVVGKNFTHNRGEGPCDLIMAKNTRFGDGANFYSRTELTDCTMGSNTVFHNEKTVLKNITNKTVKTLNDSF